MNTRTILLAGLLVCASTPAVADDSRTSAQLRRRLAQHVPQRRRTRVGNGMSDFVEGS